MQARIKWVEGLTFVGESASGHQVMMDGNSGDKSPSPMEMVLLAVGSCSAADVVSLLQQHQPITDCEVKLTSQRQTASPRMFTQINLHFIVTGRKLKAQAVEQAIQCSLEKYCSVALMLEKTVTVSHSYEIVTS
ncbi:protein YhfA [Salmonella enterica subsp. enterica serovar Choleraesuis]|nr:protein YhfA [Salmonella enterica subsp. enterica serovar Choleraesuis]